MSNTYGYVRVSTKDQNEHRQLLDMAKYGVAAAHIYLDKQSGKDFNRPAYKKLLKRLKPGDLIVVKSIDRLGRNYQEIIEQWRIITKEKSVDIVVMDMPLLDTRVGKDLLGTFISDIFLQILSFVAQNERDNTKQRQREGIDAAKLRGVRFGRPEKVLPENFEHLCKLWKTGQITADTAARRAGLSRSSFYRLAKGMPMDDERPKR